MTKNYKKAIAIGSVATVIIALTIAFVFNIEDKGTLTAVFYICAGLFFFPIALFKDGSKSDDLWMNARRIGVNILKITAIYTIFYFILEAIKGNLFI